MCYVCQEQESNKDCLTISMCQKEDKYCVTIRNNIGTGTLLNITLFVLWKNSPRNGLSSHSWPHMETIAHDHQQLGTIHLVAHY